MNPESLHQEALAIRRQLLGEEHAEFLDSLHNLAGVLSNKGDYAGAETLYRKVLALRRKTLGDVHLDVATTLNNLALLLESKGDYRGAESLYREALEIDRKLLGEEHPDVATIMNNVAILRESQGDFATAESLYRDSLALRRKALGKDHVLVANSLHNLAHMLESAGDYSAAEPLYRQSLAIFRKQLGNEHPNVAVNLDNLAGLLAEKGAYAESERLQREALELFRKTFGGEHPEVATCMGRLASLLMDMGDYDGAASLQREVLAIRRKFFGDEHPVVATSLNNIATLLATQGEYAGAESLHREALAMQRKLLGEDHPEVITSIHNLASLLLEKGDYASAEPLFREALALRRRVAGNDHPDVAAGLNNLAALLYRMGDYTAAEVAEREAHAILRRHRGEEHPEVALVQCTLANALREKGDFAAAERLYREAIEIQRKTLGAGHPDVARAMNELAILLRAKGEMAAAERLQRDAVDLLRASVNHEHPDLAAGLHNLAVLLADKGDYANAVPLLQEALAIRESLRSRIVGAERERAHFAEKLALSVTANRLADALLRQGRFEEALSVVERGRGRALLDLLGRSDRDLVAVARVSGGQATAASLDRLLSEEYAARVAVTTAEKTIARIRERGDRSEQKQELVEKAAAQLEQCRQRLRDAEHSVLARLREVWPDIRIDRLVKHLFVAGLPGAGKTTADMHMLLQLAARGIPFLVLETAKTEYRTLKALRTHRKKALRKFGQLLEVYTIGAESVSPFRYNPLELRAEISQDEKVETLLACFQAAMSLPGPAQPLIGEALERVYAQYGDAAQPPVVADLVAAANQVLEEKAYSGDTGSDIRAALEVRLGSLARRNIGRVFQCRTSVPSIEHLMESCSVIELDKLPVEQSCLLSLFLLTAVREYVRTTARPDRNPRFVIVIEEAHNIVGRSTDARASEDIADPKSHAAEYVCRMLAELRALGVAIIIVDQLPSAVAPEVIKNTASKLTFREVANDDRADLGGTMLFTETEFEEIGRLETGESFFSTEGYHGPRRIQTINLHDELALPSAIQDQELVGLLRDDPWFIANADLRVSTQVGQLVDCMNAF